MWPKRGRARRKQARPGDMEEVVTKEWEVEEGQRGTVLEEAGDQVAREQETDPERGESPSGGGARDPGEGGRATRGSQDGRTRVSASSKGRGRMQVRGIPDTLVKS